MTSKLGEIILTRDFESLNNEGTLETIQLRVGKPYLKTDTETSAKWRCHFQLSGIGFDQMGVGPGFNSIHAFLSCLQLAEMILRRYGETQNRKITWHGFEDLGFNFLDQVRPAESSEIATEVNSSFQKAFDEFFRNWK